MDQLWRKYRDQFPVTEHLIYLNHAGVAPLCRPAADAMRDFAREMLESGALHFENWVRTYEGLRCSAARLINATPDEIAIVKNTSEGLATVAAGIDWKPGDAIVAFREEFPANYFPWRRLEERGIEVRWLSIFDSLDLVDQACKGARLLSVSFVQYLSGYRANLEKMGEICVRHNCLFLVDAIQGMGAFPIDVRRARIGALAADGHKWMLGPEGCGVLFVRRDLQDRIEPVEFGWSNVAKYNDFDSRDMGLRQDAGRYECGALNTVGCYGLHAALDFILEIGVEHIARAVESLGDRLAYGVTQLGFETLGTRAPETGAGIVSFRKRDVDSRLIVRRLTLAGIVAALRGGWVRVSPHFYISPEEIDRVLEHVA